MSKENFAPVAALGNLREHRSDGEHKAGRVMGMGDKRDSDQRWKLFKEWTRRYRRGRDIQRDGK